MSKTAQTAAKTAKTRLPGNVALANRQRFTFGPAYTQAVLAGVCTDKPKMVAHAFSLGVGSVNGLAAQKLETVRRKLAAAILAAGDEAPVRFKLVKKVVH